MPITATDQTAILNSEFIALVVVKDRHILWANAAMHRLFGYAPDELIGMPTRPLFPDQAGYEAFGRELDAALKESGAFSGTFRQRRKDGSAGWFEFSVSHHSGHPGQVVGAISDGTARHDLATKLQASEQRYRSVVEDQTEVINRLLPDGTFVFVNETYCRMFQKSSDELIGQRWHPAAHPDDLAMIEARLREMSPANPVVIVENRVLVAGGELRWMQFVNRGFYDATGTLTEIQAVGRDITRLKETESVLRESDERLAMALAASGLVLWDWNIPERKVTAGGRWFEMLGYSEMDLGSAEDDWMKLVHPEDLGRFEQAISNHLSGDTAEFASEHRLRHKDGHWVSVQARGKVTVRAQDYAPLRMIGTLLDVSRQKRLQEAGLGLLTKIESLIRETSSRSGGAEQKIDVAENLTKRQRQILGMIAGGMTSVQIGKRLRVATNTVVTHRKNLMAKLDLHTAAELTQFALKHGLVIPK